MHPSHLHRMTVSILQSFSENRVCILFVMSFHYAILAILACTAGTALGASAGGSAMSYKCDTKQPSVCYVNNITLESRDMKFDLVDADDRKTLKLKAGRVQALLPQHCQSLWKFEKILIGRVGLQELCFTTTVVEVNAEHNHIKELHVEEGATYSVEVLRLNDNHLENIDAIHNFAALKELHLERNFLSKLNMVTFGGMTHLKELHLAHNRINLISTTISELSFPALEFIGLQNNTLTALDLQHWSLPALLKLELSSNDLTNVLGIEKFETLSEISLARNRWHCSELEQILEVLANNDVTVKDGDQDCSAIRNGTICCTYVQQDSEQTLLDELKKFSDLEQRYNEAENMFGSMIMNEIQKFEARITELQQTSDTQNDAKNPKNKDPSTETAEPTEQSVETQVASECECSKESMDQLESMLNAMEAKINENGLELQALLKDKSHFEYSSALAKHEFRTAFNRGEYKLKELSSMLAMLREHIKQQRH